MESSADKEEILEAVDLVLLKLERLAKLPQKN